MLLRPAFKATSIPSQPIEGLPVLLTNDSAQRVLRQVGLEEPTAFLLPNGYENIAQKSGDALKSLIIPFSFGAKESDPYQYNPAEAMKLLAASGNAHPKVIYSLADHPCFFSYARYPRQCLSVEYRGDWKDLWNVDLGP